jgi:hypothetical protein
MAQARKSLRMCGVGPGEHGPSRRQALLGQAMLHIMAYTF